MTQWWRRHYVKTTSFWRKYVKMMSFWRNKGVIIVASCLGWGWGGVGWGGGGGGGGGMGWGWGWGWGCGVVGVVGVMLQLYIANGPSCQGIKVGWVLNPFCLFITLFVFNLYNPYQCQGMIEYENMNFLEFKTVLLVTGEMVILINTICYSDVTSNADSMK